MESEKLIHNGLNLANTLIAYLAKDAVGGEFLNSYLGEQSAQTVSADKQREALNRLVETSTEMQQATGQMADRAEKNIERLASIYTAISALKESAAKIEEEHKKYAGQFKKLIEQTTEIKRQIDDISEISERTNLLSFNASIEAAHAGSLGAGFRIIANEVKSLSENTQKSTERIMANMEKLAASITLLERDTKNNANALQSLAEETESTLERFDSVRKLNAANNNDVEQIGSAIAANMRDMDTIVQNIQQAEDLSKKSISLFADSASKNEMLFNDLYSFAYEIKAVFEDLQRG
ncbi:MAG: hypothetical protein IJP62_09115 [Treponema sp.]|nr:hypothetical protein [Treponema sp.]